MELVENIQVNKFTKKNKKAEDIKKHKLHIFCPDFYVSKVSRLLEENNFEFDINNHTEYPSKLAHKYLHFSSRLLEEEDKEFLVRQLKYGQYVRPLVDCLDEHFKYTFIELLNSDYFLHRPSFSSLRERKLWIIKRISDAALSFFLLIFTSPIMLLTAILIKLDSKGSIFYKQERLGKFNIPFKIIKFRSMRSDAEKNGAQWADINDNRITRVGKWIRLLRIDELPQLFNVLKGEMSLVGPRPEREVFVEELEKHIPYYRFRHAVKPGITGWAQVNYPYGASIEDAKWKHRYDMYYIKHQTFSFDIKTLIKTIGVIFFGKGR